MKNTTWIIDVVGGSVVLLLLALLIVLIVMMPDDCAAKATRMGLPHEFHYVGGCMIEARPGVWVPMKNYRVEGAK